MRIAAPALDGELVELGAGEPTFDTGRAAAGEVLAAKLTAVMAFNDQMALGVMSTLHERGVSVPGDLSVIGCDDVPMAGMVSPALTTIHLPTDAAGSAALELLLTQEEAPTALAELTAHLVVRASTGPLR